MFVTCMKLKADIGLFEPVGSKHHTVVYYIIIQKAINWHILAA